MKASEVHNSADPDVVELIGNKRQELFNLRFQHATGQLEDTAGLQRAKRDLARALTVARERGIVVERELAREGKAREPLFARSQTQLKSRGSRRLLTQTPSRPRRRMLPKPRTRRWM